MLILFRVNGYPTGGGLQSEKKIKVLCLKCNI